ncbi:protein kinase [Massospora cicadina]|nr:protein kinase [Massospora cicadina]
MEPTVSSEYDIDIIEENKENILPLPSGRKVSHLTTLLSKPPEEREAELHAEKRRFEFQIARAKDSEVFEIYYDYVKWTIMNYPGGHSAQSNLFNLLEHVCFAFNNDVTLKEDPRYFELWMLYAKQAESPPEIFLLLDGHGIGTHLAARYEEEANYHETNNKIHLAKQVYERGLKLETKPEGALGKNYAQFQRRTAGFKPTVTPIERNALRQSDEGVSFVEPNQPAKPAPIKAFDIFRDPEGTSGTFDAFNDAAITNYGPKHLRIRENIPVQTAWSALTIPQANFARPTLPKLEIWRDDQEEVACHESEGLVLYLMLVKFIELQLNDDPPRAPPTNSGSYFVERGSGQPGKLYKVPMLIIDACFELVIDKGLFKVGTKDELSFEELRWDHACPVPSFKQPGTTQPLSNSKPANELLSGNIARDRRRPGKVDLAGSRLRTSFPTYGTSAPISEFRNPTTCALPKTTSFHGHLTLDDAALDDDADIFYGSPTQEGFPTFVGEFESLLERENGAGGRSSSDLDSTDLGVVQLSGADSDTTPLGTRTPSMMLLLRCPTERTQQALKLVDDFFSQPVDTPYNIDLSEREKSPEDFW